MTLSQMESSIRLEEDVPLVRQIWFERLNLEIFRIWDIFSKEFDLFLLQRVIEMRTNEMNLANLYKAYILTLKESEKIG